MTGGGGRIGSPAYRESLLQSDDFTGLEEDVGRYDLLLLVKLELRVETLVLHERRTLELSLLAQVLLAILRGLHLLQHLVLRTWQLLVLLRRASVLQLRRHHRILRGMRRVLQLLWPQLPQPKTPGIAYTTGPASGKGNDSRVSNQGGLYKGAADDDRDWKKSRESH